MNTNHRDVPWLDYPLFRANQDKFPEDELLKYADKYVAWSMDGTQILAWGDDEIEMEKRLKELGIDPSRVVGAYNPPPDMSIL